MSTILDNASKLPPQSIEIEKVVLGAIMIEKMPLALAMSRLFPEVFYLDVHSVIFKTMQGLYDKNRPIDELTVTEHLKNIGKLEYCGGDYYIAELTKNVVSSANIEFHIAILSELYIKREAIRLSWDLAAKAFDEATDAFEIVNLADVGFQKMQERVLGGITKDIEYFGMQVLDQHATTKETGVLGLKTGFNTLDKVISGLVPPDLIILAARPGQGKTAFALSLTYNTCVKGDSACAWFSLEMDGVQLTRRLASIDSQIDHERIRKGLTSNEEDIKLGESIEKISSAKIFIEDNSSVNVRDIRTRASLLKKKHDIKFIVVDYIQLMNGIDTKGKSREQIVSDISRNLKLLAKELSITVIALSQLSRAVESRPDKMPQLSDLRESGGIEQDADSVMFLMRPSYYKMENEVSIGGKDYHPNGLAIGIIEKNRHGSTKNIAFNFNGSCMHFTDHELDAISPYQPINNYSAPYHDKDAPF